MEVSPSFSCPQFRRFSAVLNHRKVPGNRFPADIEWIRFARLAACGLRQCAT
jgi:hypothetical protein